MSKRTFPLIALVLTTAVLFTVVAHACSDLSAFQAIVQAPCDHASSQNEPRGKPDKDTCDSVRYGMLSTQASFAAVELLKFYSIAFQYPVFVGFSLSDSQPSSWRSQALPFSGVGVLPYLSHLVLRI
jgi:hypothetical protein